MDALLGQVSNLPSSPVHHFKDGVIIHDDIQLSQFLWTDETKTSVRLNDFNRAEVMFWDEEFEEYCRFHNGRGHGDVSQSSDGISSFPAALVLVLTFLAPVEVAGGV